MNSTLEKYVEQIHKSNLYGIVVETGCSTALTSKLMDVTGASNTVYLAKQPYSKQYQEHVYGQMNRSVSREFAELAIQKELELIPTEDLHKVNFIITSTWQMSEDAEHITHGWFGVWYFGQVYHLHFTFLKGPVFTRDKIVDLIGKIGINILHSLVADGNMSALEERFIFDDVENNVLFDQAYVGEEVDYQTILTHQDNDKRNDYFLVFKPNILDAETIGPVQMFRFEELMRAGKEFIINKGSFNPIHHQHVSMMEAAYKMHPEAIPVFLISTYRYDKPHIDADDLRERIQKITSQGYAVIICKEIFFYNTFNLLRRHSPKDAKFWFAVGVDTMNRIYQTDLDKAEGSTFKARVTIDGMKRIFSERFKFLVFERTGYEMREEVYQYDTFMEIADGYHPDDVSSTAIREGRMVNKLDFKNESNKQQDS
jgi:nicotinic acid mononucleotide adenylyltransferase